LFCIKKKKQKKNLVLLLLLVIQSFSGLCNLKT
jgi:hypothetical protein